MAAVQCPPPTRHAALVFSSVFPPASLTHTTPTPIATPDLGSSNPDEAFGSVSNAAATRSKQGPPISVSPAANEVKRTLAWSTATRSLSLPRDGDGLQQRSGRASAKETIQAVRFLMIGDGRTGSTTVDASLIDWYVNEITNHFTGEVRPQIRAKFRMEIPCTKARSSLEEIAQVFERVQAFYFRSFDEYIRLVLNETAMTRESETTAILSKFKRQIFSLFAQAVDWHRYAKTLSYFLYEAGCELFVLHNRHHAAKRRNTAHPQHVQKAVIALLRALSQVGLGDEPALRASALALDRLMSRFIQSDYMKVDWVGRRSVVPNLRHWIEDGFAPFARMLSECLGGSSRTDASSAAETQLWSDMAVSRLGQSRVANLFDYVVHWDESAGAIEDLKEYITTNADRAYLVVTFDGQLHRRLLKPGVTTTHILDTYISMIQSFRELDPRGVLLDRVAGPVRKYLKDRSDAARIIVSSLLADDQDADRSRADLGSEVSGRITAEMFTQGMATVENDNELNFNDMEWTPEPHDASSGYKSSKGNDNLSYLLSLFETEDIITELKNILGDHLLKTEDSDFDKEFRLLELFKLRLGEAQLQPCEVMLRDVRDSKRLTKKINESQPTGPPIQAQIVSSFFWPQLREEEFKVPSPVSTAQDLYAAGFQSIKAMRKLNWLPALGKVDVELQLEDRTLQVECSTWQASVIYAFQRADGEPQRVGGVARTIEYLERTLEMDEELVANAIAFWIGERVIAPHPSQDDTYIVLERLSSSNVASAAEVEAAKEQAASTAPDAGVVSADDLLDRNRGIYETFIIGMLTNQGGMSKARMLMMLKMVVPGGFPGGEEEVGEVLDGLRGEGKVDKGGGDAWTVIKKTA